jgi:hypothetical protein
MRLDRDLVEEHKKEREWILGVVVTEGRGVGCVDAGDPPATCDPLRLDHSGHLVVVLDASHCTAGGQAREDRKSTRLNSSH